MTREEAIASYEKLYDYMVGDDDAIELDYGEFMELNYYIRSALRPVSREQVEKVWRGEWHSHYKSGIQAGNGVVCSECDMWNNRAAHFCPSCGAPMTDEAVDMMLERWKEVVDGE